MLRVIIIISSVFLITEGKHLPSYINPCRRDDPNLNECALKSAQAAIPYIVKGDKEYGIPVMTPLYIPEILLQTGNNLRLNMRDVYLHGLENAVLTNTSYDLKKKHITGELAFKSLTIEGQYEVNGQILILPIKGTGMAKLTCNNLVVKYTLNYKLVTKDGKEHIDNILPEISYTVEKLHFDLENLFNGDQDLVDKTNQFLNEHAAELNEDLSKSITDTIKILTGDLLNRLHLVVPYEEIFI